MTGHAVADGAPTVDPAVELLVPGDEESYDEFVGRHPAAMIYYSSRFRDMLVALLGCSPVYAIARRGGEMVGVFPLMLASGPHGEVLNSLPYFGSNGGALCAQDDEPTLSALLHWYHGQADRAVSATVVENPLFRESGAPASVSSERISVVTALPSPGEGRASLLQGIDSSARRNVLKAERSGVEVSVASEDPSSLEALAHLHSLSMQVNGGLAKTPTFFELLPTVLRPAVDYQLYLATVGGETVGALLVMFCGTVADYYMPATHPAARPLQPMAALLCFAMLDAADRGCTSWNWGGSGIRNETLVRFKMKWGGRQSTYRYLTLLNDEKLLAVPPADLLDSYPGFFVRPFAPEGPDAVEMALPERR